MQFLLGLCLLTTVLVVQGCIDQCEILNATQNASSFTPIEDVKEKEAARSKYRKMMEDDCLQPRDTLINLSPPKRFKPPSIFVKRCFPIDRRSGSLVVQTANVTRNIPVKRMVSQKWVFYNVTVVEHIKCGFVPIKTVNGTEPNRCLNCQNYICKSIDED